MIRIKFENEARATKDYLTSIHSRVELRLKILKTSLEHLQKKGITDTADEFLKYKHVTRKIINSLEKKEDHLPESNFNVGDYSKNVKAYLAGSKNKMNKLNLKGLTDFTKFMLKAKARELSKLLICPADQLAVMSGTLLHQFNIGSKLNLNILKLAFNYTAFNDEISVHIKKFFRDNNLVTFCPYCNINETDYSETPEGEVATIHYLDHFFDKATSPLLCYSMFNLIPCDGICNSINKDTNNFDDDYHLNPYISGFGIDRMCFEPEIGKVDGPLKSIQLRIIPLPGTPKYKQLIGNETTIRESNAHGNVNVFKLKTKYNKTGVLKMSGTVIRKINDTLSTRNSLKHFLDRMNLISSIDNYKKWYFEEFNTEFEENQFHENAYSKLIRDLHDGVISTNSDAINLDIKVYSSKR